MLSRQDFSTRSSVYYHSTPVSVSIDLSGIRPRPKYVVLEQLTASGPVPISYLEHQGKEHYVTTFSASSPVPDQLLFQVVVAPRKLHRMPRRGASPPFAIHMVLDPSVALAAYEAFLETLPPGGEDDPHIPLWLPDIPPEILSDFAQISGPDGMAVMEIGSLTCM